MRDPENIRAVEALGIDWMGFIFHPSSPRNVDSRPSYLPAKAKRVGVFVNADIDAVRRIADSYQLDIIQLHGDETPEYLQALSGFTLIKAVNIATKDDLLKTEVYEGLADYLLFDTKAEMAGGNGIKFNWDLLSGYSGQTPFLLSGGIGPDDAPLLSSFRHPRFAGIDLNSRFESMPAMKDIQKLKHFLEEYE